MDINIDINEKRNKKFDMLHGLTRAQVRTELNLFRSFVGLY